MFPQEYINRGQCTFTNCSVSLWSDSHHCKDLCNLPCGHVVNAYWQVVQYMSSWRPDGITFTMISTVIQISGNNNLYYMGYFKTIGQVKKTIEDW